MFSIRSMADARYFVENIKDFCFAYRDYFIFGFRSSQPGEVTFFNIKIIENKWLCKAASRHGFEDSFDTISEPVSFVFKYKAEINRHLKEIANDQYLSTMIPSVKDLSTASEAARLWNLDESTVKKACQQNRFTPDEARKSGRTWLVTLAGMERLYGPRPTEETESRN